MENIKSLLRYLSLMLAAGGPALAFSQAVPVNLGQDTAICGNESLLLDATFPNSTYLWSNGATSPTVTVTSFPATFSVTVTDTTGTYTPGSDTINISGLNIPPVAINPSGTVAVCTGGSLLLTGSNGGTSIWYRDGVQIPGPHSNSYLVTTPGTYNMTKTNLNGCTDSAAVGTTVNFVSPPVAGWSAAIDSFNITPGAVYFTDSSANATSWIWDFGDGNTSTDQNPVHIYSLAGNYTVVQTALNSGCQDTVSGVVVTPGAALSNDPFMEQNLEAFIYPNPAGDVLHIYGESKRASEFYIFDLAGKMIMRQELIAFAGEKSFDVSQLTNGMYLVEWRDLKGRSVTKKIVLQH